MFIRTEIQSGELPAIFQRLFEIVPHRQWERRIAEFKYREQRNRFLGSYFDDKFPIERALGRALEYRKSTGRYPRVTGSPHIHFYELYSFAATLVRVYQRLSATGQRSLAGRLRGGLI